MIPDVAISPLLDALASFLVDRSQGLRYGVADRRPNGPDCQPGDNLQQEMDAFDSRNRTICARELGIREHQILKVLPTTAMQSHMLMSFLHSSSEIHSDRHSYINHTMLTLKSDVDNARMRKAWDAVTGYHDLFQIVFCCIDDDMAPFAQCRLELATFPKHDWNLYTMSRDGCVEEAAEEAIRKAEESITLSRPTWKLSMISSPGKNTVLILSAFHGILDDTSLKLLLNDVSSAYQGMPLSQNGSFDHIAKRHCQADHTTTANFWASYLDQYSPIDFPSVTSHRHPSVTITEAVELTSRMSIEHLRSQCRKIGSTSFSALQAAWGSILLSYTGSQEQDVVMGNAISGQLDTGPDACIGSSSTIVPLRLLLSQVPSTPDGIVTNRSVMHHLAKLNAKTLPHLQPRLGSFNTAEGRLPYDTVLSFHQDDTASIVNGPWADIRHLPLVHDFTVMVDAWPTDTCLTIRVTFRNSHMDKAAAEMMLRQMDDMLNFILDNPDADFASAATSSSLELKSAYNITAQVPPEVNEGSLLHSCLERNAEANPDHVALIFKGDLDNEASQANVSWTYAELNNKADSLAEYLVRTYDSLSNMTVPICIDKSPAMYVAILGVLKAGGAWCPIDTFSPPQRRHDLVARTGTRVLLVSSLDGAQPEGYVPVGVDVVDISIHVAGFPHGTAISNLNKAAKQRTRPDDMAYMIWTSGTTGAPKGVPIRHSAAVSCMNSLEKCIPSDVAGGVIRCLQFSQYAFDVSIQDMFYTWSLGGVLISATREILLGRFPELANATQATHAHLTPAFGAGVSRKSCETLQVITMIGEKLTPSVADDWGTDMRAFNTYGPAEATIVSTVREFGNEHKCVKSANVGWPLDTVSAFVMRNGKLAMRNAVGELALGGPQLSTGYLNQDDVTKKKYVWSDEVSQVLYYTGDLVRMLADGSVEYLNRVDDQVKFAGIRVELSEISYYVAQCHPLVENVETLILSRPDRPMPILVSFLRAPRAAATEGSGSEGDLLIFNETSVEIARAAGEKAHVYLPGHMTPSVYLVVTHIPRTQSAKTDHRALENAYTTVDLERWEARVRPDITLKDDENLHHSFRKVDDEKIHGVIASMANVSPSLVTAGSRLAGLGIDSIRAIRLASRLNESGYKLSVVGVINCVTVRDLTALASSSSREGGQRDIGLDDFNRRWHDKVAGKVHQGDFYTAPASAIQESLLSESMQTYNMYWSNHFFSLDVSAELQQLRQAWTLVSQRTDALRTGFIPVAEVREVDDEENTGDEYCTILQVIRDSPFLDWEVHECTDKDFQEILRGRLERIMYDRQGHYFTYPPWAVTIFNKGGERILMFTIHHSLHDGPSISFILEDVQAAYDSKLGERFQLRDALARTLPTNSEIQATSRFWQDELREFSHMDVPTWPDLTGKRVSSGSGSISAKKLISDRILLTDPAERLQSAAVELGLPSVASILRAAWGCVSLCYLGTPATVFGETLSDRVLHSSLENIVGPFISVVPVPFRQSGTVREFLNLQHSLSVQARKYRHVHAREVRKHLNLPRGQTLYPGIFIFHSGEDGAHSSSGLWKELEDEAGLHVEHPMAFNAFEDSAGGIAMEAFVDSLVMSRDHLSLYLRQIDAFVSAMLLYPDEEISDLLNHLPSDLLSVSKGKPSENVTKSFSTSPVNWLEFNAAKHPDWTAVEVASSISEDGITKQTMSYSSLNSEANRVAAFIASLGFKNRMIALCSGRSLLSYAVIVGIFKSGNAYLPIDEGLPNERKNFLIQDGNSPLVFIESAFAHAFTDTTDTCRIICFDEPQFYGSLANMPSGNMSRESDPEDVAYLLYTSGSTGKPKGVMVTRGNLSSFIESISEFACRVAPATLELGGKGRYLAQASRAFDPHVLEMLFPWRHGMATVTGPRLMLLDDLELTLSKWEITHASLVPSLLDQTDVRVDNCRALKFLTVGGEKISQKVLDTWGASPSVALVNAYGPTEATIGCTFALVGKESTVRNIGPPLNACVGHVLIPGTLKYALRGQTGEICFSGSLVAKGYLNRPDAKGFVIGPDGEKIYRTGDIGRLMVNDTVEYLGRGDDQTKIRGQRLELGEVSEVIRSSSSIGIQVVTMIAKHPQFSRGQLVSFIARSGTGTRKHSPNEQVEFLQSDFSTLAKDIRDSCTKKLPAYMVPEIILPVTFIPLSAISAKANVKELQALFSRVPFETIVLGNSAPINGAAGNRSLTEDEESVVKQISSVSSINSSNITPLTNIFEIGLDSLSAIGLSVKLRSIGYDVSVASVLSNPIVEQIARLPRSQDLDNKEPHDSVLRQRLLDLQCRFWKDAPREIQQESISAVRPCLPLQEGLVARSMNSRGRQLYVNHVPLQLNNSVDASMLKRAWNKAAAEYEIMRTSFAPMDDGIVQLIHSSDSYELPWTEETYVGIDEAVEGLRMHEEELSQEIVNEISPIPPLRLILARSSVDQAPLVLLVAIHHALYDGESFSMLMSDIASYYKGQHVPERGSPAAFIEHIYSQDLDKARQFWCHLLEDCEPTIFKTDLYDENDKRIAHRKLGGSISELESSAARLRTTVPSLVQAIFALSLAETVNHSDVTYGVVLSGRTAAVPGVESVIFPCVTTIPSRLKTSDLPTVIEVIRDTQHSAARSVEFQHTSLRLIKSWLEAETPLFDCLFSYVRIGDRSENGLWQELESDMPADYPLAVEVEADSKAGEANIHCHFTGAFGSVYRAEEFVEKIDAILSSVISGEDTSLDHFKLSQTNGRTSRLPEPEWDEYNWTTTEIVVRKLVGSFCNSDLRHVKKSTSFLSLGLDSVTAIAFARELRRSGFQALPSDIMRFRCVGELASHFDRSAPKETDTNGISESPADENPLDAYRSNIRLLSPTDSVSAIFECTPLQSGMIMQTLASVGSVYVHPHIFEIGESMDIHLLKGSLQQVILQNDILRTSFHAIPELKSTWIGAVHSNPLLQWVTLKLDDHADILAETTSLLSPKDEMAFEIPPLRTALVSLQHRRFLVVVMHHSLYDGTSAPFLFEDLAAVYRGFVPPERPQFSNVVHYTLKGQATACEFWTNNLLGYEAVEIPPLGGPELGHPGMLATERRIDVDMSDIVQTCKVIEVTTQTVSLVAYAKAHACLIGKRDVVFGNVLAGRSLPVAGVENTMGPLFNTVPQRIRFEPKFLSNRSMAVRIQQMNIDAQDYQHASLRVIQSKLRHVGSLQATALFDTLFVFQKDVDPMESARMVLEPYEREDLVTETEHKLNFEVNHSPDGLLVRATCKAQYISQEMLERIVHDFEVAFQDIIMHPTRCSTILPEQLGKLPLQVPTSCAAGPVDQDSDGNAQESLVRRILADVANVPLNAVHADTSIFNIGLDSLSAIRIAAICRSEGLKAGVADILQGGTLRGISTRIGNVPENKDELGVSILSESAHMKSNAAERLGLPEESIETVLPCLSGQDLHLGFWINSGRTIFEPAWCYFSREQLDPKRLESCWLELRQRHPILRTCFLAISPSEVLQVVLKEAHSDENVFKVVHSAVGIKETAKAQATEEATQPSSLFTPPVRLRVLKALDGDGILVRINHAAYDAWTMPMFVSELSKMYNNQPLRSNPDFPAFVDYSLRVLRKLDEEQYWKSAIGSCASTVVDSNESEDLSSSYAPRQFFVGVWGKVKNLTDMETVCRSRGFGIQVIVLIAVARCLTRLTDVDSPTFGLYQIGRSAAFAGVEMISGPCLNVTPFTVHEALHRDTVAQARSIQSSLTDRVPYEQSFLRDVLSRWAAGNVGKSKKGHLFNTWVNLLWTSPEQSSYYEDGNTEEHGLFEPLPVGVPTDFLPKTPPTLSNAMESNSVSLLDASYLPRKNIFLDVSPDYKRDTIGFGVRVEDGALSEGEIYGFVELIAEEIEGTVKCLSSFDK